MDKAIQWSIEYNRVLADRAGVSWSKWYLIKNESGKHTIRRYRNDGEKIIWQRYPKEKYRNLKASDLDAFLTRLNGEREVLRKRAEEAYKIQHTFITQEVQDAFSAFIETSVPSRREASQIINIVNKRFLHFFINQLGLTDPMDWKEEQLIWGRALLNKPKNEKQRIFKGANYVPSNSTIKLHIISANRFMAWLHERNPRLFPLIKFQPISPASLRLHEASRKLDSKEVEGIGQFIPEADWARIKKEVDPRIKSFLVVAYELGLRRSETLGVQLEDVRQGHFYLQRKLVSYSGGQAEFAPPKSRKPRKIPYWFTTAKEIYRIIETIEDRMHPDTLTDLFNQEMRRLKMSYGLHDFRRTFITRALRLHAPIDVQRAAGHSSLTTTMRYVMDDRDLSDAPFIPEAS